MRDRRRAYGVVVGTTEGKRPLERPKHRFDDNTKIIIQGCASLLMSNLFSLGGLPTHPQNPHSWRTSLSLLVWPLEYKT